MNERVRQRARKKEKEVYQERTEGEEREREKESGRRAVEAVKFYCTSGKRLEEVPSAFYRTTMFVYTICHNTVVAVINYRVPCMARCEGCALGQYRNYL